MNIENITVEQQEIIQSFKCERLSCRELNKNLIRNFSNKQGKLIVDYLLSKAWNEDINCENAYYLVKDNIGDVALFFSLKCGTLFSPFREEYYRSKISSLKDILKILELYKQERTEENRERARLFLEQYRTGNIDIKETISRIISEGKSAKDALAYLEDDKKHESNTDIHHVEKTYPAIEIVHFCVNDNLRAKWKSYNLNHPMGEVLFWQFIAPLICKMQEYVGCQYVFLFAADLSENESLINYYNIALKFQLSGDITTNKPYYDFCCRFMCQEIKDLKKHRENYFAHFNMDTNTP